MRSWMHRTAARSCWIRFWAPVPPLSQRSVRDVLRAPSSSTPRTSMSRCAGGNARPAARHDMPRCRARSPSWPSSAGWAMAEKNASASTYDVGFGKPPRATQFQKGQSGNARGRPKGSKNFEHEVKAAFGRKIVIQESGRARRITIGQAMLMKLTAKAVGGDMGALRLAIGLLQMAQPVEASGNVFDSDGDRALLLSYLAENTPAMATVRRRKKGRAR